MKTIKRDGEVWFVAENSKDEAKLTRRAHVLQTLKKNHSFIYDGPPGQENPIVKELCY